MHAAALARVQTVLQTPERHTVSLHKYATAYQRILVCDAVQSLALVTRTAAPAGQASETASLVYSPYSSTARGQALLMSSLDGHVSLYKVADAAVST